VLRVARSPLYPSQRSDEEIKLGWIHIADANDVQVRRSGRMDGESCTSFRNLRKGEFAWLLAQQDGDLVLVDSKYEQRRGLPVEIGKVSPFEGSVRRKRTGFREIEAERKTTLKPWFDGVTIRGNDLRCRIDGQDGEVLIQQFCG